jgi:hypothetical protein
MGKNILLKLVTTIAALLFLISNVLGGIRGPGEYRGVVIYDRWDTCYLYGGAYLSYIASGLKEKLRKYDGQEVIIYANDVVQPMNPGDGRITDFKFLGIAEPGAGKPLTNALRLKMTPQFQSGESKFELEIENLSGKTLDLRSSDISPTLFGEKHGDRFFSPSDGKSEAVITRCNLQTARQQVTIKSIVMKNANGEIISSRKFSLGAADPGFFSFPDSFKLAAGASKRFTISFDIPSGLYDAIFGYSEGAEGATLVSNKVSFSINENGKASVTPAPPEKKSEETINMHTTSFLLGQSNLENGINFRIL